MVRASSSKTISILRATLRSVEGKAVSNPHDPALIKLKRRVLSWIAELSLDAPIQGEGITVLRARFRL